MNKLTKRILSLVLCLCMFMSIPVMSYAAEVEKVPSIKVNNVTNSKVEIEWGKVDGAKGYEVYRMAEGEKEFNRLKRQSEVKYSDSDVKPGVLYTYKVRAYKEKNLGLTKVYGAYSTDLKVATYPSAVTGFTATPFSSKGIDLTWKAAEGAQKYAVYQYDDATREYVRLGTTDKTTFRVEGLTAETKYYFRIRSYHTLNGTLTSDWTKISVITPLGDVENFRLKTCEKKAYSIAWDKTANAEGYEIYRLDSRTGTWALFRTTKARAYNFKGVSENYNAFYKIRSYATGSNGKKIYGVFTEPVAVGTLPAKPQNLVAARNTNNGISLAWTDLNGVEGYVIFRSDALIGDKWNKIGTSDTAFFTDKTVPGTGKYKYRIQAYKGAGDKLFYSDYSDATTIEFKKAESNESIYTEELEKIGLIGYLYDPVNKCFYTANDPWQRNFGYNEIYDNAAGLTLMIIDTLRIKFPYKDKDWMIQVWKGQYGLVLVGAEVGVYTKPKDRQLEHYECAADEDFLRMEMEVQRLDTVDGKSTWNRLLYRPYDEYWWITGFVFGNELGNYDNVRVNIRITMKDYEMLEGVTKSLKAQGYYYEVKGLDVFFTFR